MPLDASIILSGAPPRTEPLNLLSNYAQLQQIQQNRIAMSAHQQSLQMGALSQKAAELHLADQQLSSQQNQEMLGILKENNGNVPASIQQGMARGLPQAQELLKHQGAAEELLAKTQKEQAEAARATYDVKAKQRQSAINSLSTLRGLAPELKPLYYQHLRMQALQAHPNLGQQLPMNWSAEAEQMVGALQNSLLSQKEREDIARKDQEFGLKEQEFGLKEKTEQGREQRWEAQTEQGKRMADLREREIGQEGAYQRGRLSLSQREASEASSPMTLPPEAMANATEVYQKTGVMPPLGMGKSAAKVRSDIMNSAASQYGHIDLAAQQQHFKNQPQAMKAFGTGTQGQQITAINTAIGHLSDGLDAAEAMGNNSFRPGNKVYNKVRTAFGSDAVTNFDQFKRALAGEVVRSLTGRVTQSELEDFSNTISSSSSPQQLRKALKNNAEIMGSKLNALQDTGKRMDLKDTDKYVSPRSKEALGKMGLDPETMRPVSKGADLSPSVQSAIQNALPKGAKIKSVKKVSD